MKTIYFTENEARERVGDQIEALSHFPSVPEGTQGKVMKVRKMGSDAWVICVEWDLPRKKSQYYAMFGEFSVNFSMCSNPVTDDFTKEDFESLVRPLEPAERSRK